MIHIVRGLFLLSVLVITASFAMKVVSNAERKTQTDASMQQVNNTDETSPFLTGKAVKPLESPRVQPTSDVVTYSSDNMVNFITLYILTPALCACGIVFVDMFWRKKQLSVLGGLFFGVLAGLALAYILGMIVDLVLEVFQVPDTDPIVALVKYLLGATVIFFCITIVLQTKDEFRFIIPYVEFSKNTKGNQPVLLDTSVIIDGRIADVVETKVLQSELIVPRFVLTELQAVADSEDKLKRNRGRRGLDVLQKLQMSDKVDVNIVEFHLPTVQGADDVDAKLVALGEHLGARIITNDYNLNKVARLKGLDVINLNDLANALKPIVLPGERMKVKIIKPGEEPGQGVGYLDDGTMVVVDYARSQMGKMVNITVTSVLQTSAGRMIFGKYEDELASVNATDENETNINNG
ncbi:MAG TPA: TRAM domain-containing protein [Phycisphaerae bacterium]|nr:TRAM domain-containing protein [Phycisphaerae bacterium]HPS52696.1 TRAM domain-containing protein [Phycisphaerae bacterium]